MLRVVDLMLGIIDLIQMMSSSYTIPYCHISWGYKSFVEDFTAILSLVYLHFVRKRIKDPMTQNIQKEIGGLVLCIIMCVILSV